MRKKRNIILKGIIAALVIVIVGTLLYILIKTIGDNNSRQKYEEYKSSYAEQTTTANADTAPSIDAQNAENPIDFDALRAQNSDIYSWIYIPGTNVNYPVCQSSENDNFYLNHDIDKNFSYAGAIYSQCSNKLDYSDRVTVLYGHNMANGSMFATLHRFEDKEFFSKNKYIYIYTSDRKLTYEIVSAFVYDDRHILNSFDFSVDEVFKEYLETITNPHSVYKNVREGIDLSVDDKILTLSTCLNSGEGRYLVQGVLIKDELTK